MKIMLNFSALFLLAMVSAEMPDSQSLARRRELAYDLGVTGDTPEEVCVSFQELWFGDEIDNVFHTQCSCQGSKTDGYIVNCADACETCFEGICSTYSISASLRGSDLQATMDVYCETFSEGFDGVTLCLETKEKEPDSYETDVHFLINDIACTNTTEIDCSCGEEIDEVLGNVTVCLANYLVDCSNLGYGENMNLCTGEGAVGPFEYYYNLLSVDDFSNLVGSCLNTTAN